MNYNRRIRRKKRKYKKIKKNFKRGRGIWDNFKKAWNGTIGFY